MKSPGDQASLAAVVVLGCGFRVDGSGRPAAGALARRAAAGAAAFFAAGAAPGAIVVASGGRAWQGQVEADAIARELARLGVPGGQIVRERCSLSTRDNARFCADTLRRRGIKSAAVVTCDWHLGRAVVAFRHAGLEVSGVPATSGPARWTHRVWRWGRERIAALAIPLGVAALGGCSRSSAHPGPVFDATPEAATDGRTAIERAEDTRRAKDVPTEAQRSHDAAARRLAARALARILDADDSPLTRCLDDDDDEVIAWGAYGLGESCRDHEESHTKALAARLASLDPTRPIAGPLDARVAILRALGRCAGDVAEQTLRAWIRRAAAASETLESAAYALGDVAARRGSLSLESSSALLDAAQRSPPVDAALYPFGRTDAGAGEDLASRLLAVARASLARPGTTRFFAVRALGRGGPDGADNLARVLASGDFTPAERAEAARGLTRLHKAGQASLADALASIVPDRADALAGDAFGVLHAAVEAVSDELGHKAETALWAVARLDLPAGAGPPLARRLSQLRCAAASRLAHGGWDSEVVRGCDVADGEAGERARLATLERRDITHARRAAWLDLVHSAHMRVREAALEVIERHPELGDAALPVLAEALAASEAGIVATAADVVHAHPDRVYVLAASERRAALDPHSPPPTANPARELDAGVAKGLRAALAHSWSEDLVETRVALLDAALAVGLDEGRAFAEAACHDANTTVRSRAAKALAAAGDKGASCPAPEGRATAAPEIDQPLSHATRVVLDTDAGTLGLRFDPVLAPVATARFVALARSGFYTGVVVHRVVHGFVAQLGNRGGDGYGGSGDSLRCETSPVAFGALDIGVALAGRDTGSSQVFVTLARHPHLDGQYAWVGRADGDWDAVAEGDIVRAVHVEP